MIVFTLAAIVSAYVLSVIFFKNEIKSYKLKHVVFLIIGLIPVVNLVLALILFIFDKNTLNDFFE